MKLDEALEQLDVLSELADRTRTFDGLRSLPTFATSAIGMSAACLQPVLLADSHDPLLHYLVLWTGIALLSLIVVVGDMAFRYYSDPTARSRRMTIDVLTRLAPSIVVGGFFSLVVLVSAPEISWLLPGMWSVMLGLGVFAAAPLLPRSLHRVGVWYVSCGFAVLILARNELALHPLSMAIPFGVGQFFAASLIRRCCEIGE